MENEDTPSCSSRNVFLADRPDTALLSRGPFLAVPARVRRCYQSRILYYFFSICKPTPRLAGAIKSFQ
jgi:hypothetical protein